MQKIPAASATNCSKIISCEFQASSDPESNQQKTGGATEGLKIQPGALHTTKNRVIIYSPTCFPRLLVATLPPNGIWYTMIYLYIWYDFYQFSSGIFTNRLGMPQSHPDVNILHPMDPPVLQDLDPIPPIRREHTWHMWTQIITGIL